MLPAKELTRGGARSALSFNAAGSAPRAEECMRCGLKRVPHSTIVVVCAEGRTVEAAICGSCTRRMGR